MKKLIALLLAVAMVFGLVACGGKAPAADAPATDAPAADAPAADAPAADAPAAEQEYLRLNWEYINSNKTGFQAPALMGNYLDTNLLWNNLVRCDVETGEIVYELAKDLVISDDGLTYTFTLADAYWHDGTPVTAADVVFTYNAQILGPWPTYASKLADVKGYQDLMDGKTDRIEGIYAKDDKTVVFEFNNPNYTLMSMSMNNIFAIGWFAILPAHILDTGNWDDMASSDYWTAPIGTGPFMVEEVSYPNYAVLTRNENYFKAPAAIEKVLLTSYTDMEAQIAAAMAGDLYSMRAIAKTSAEDAAAQNADLAYYEHDSAFYRGFGFQMAEGITQYPDLQKKEVRQALNLIIDKQALADYLGSASPATTYNNDLETNPDIPKWTRDVETGKAMLDAAGFDYNQTLKILAYYTDQATIDILDIVCANLAEAGINAEYTIDAQTSNDSWATGEYALYYFGGGYNTAVYQEWVPGGPKEAGTMNGFETERRQEYADLLAQYQNTADAAGRKVISGQLQAMFVEDAYMCVAYFMNTGYLVNSGKLQGWTGVSQDYESMAVYDFSQWTLAE